MRQARGLAPLGALAAALGIATWVGVGPWALRWDRQDAVARSSRIAVLNPSRLTPEVRVTYFGHSGPDGGKCADQRIPHAAGPRTLKAGEIVFFDQGDAAASGLPDDCRAAAVVQATGGSIAAVVVDAGDGDATAAAYLPGSARRAATRVGVPRWHKGDGLPRSTTRVHVMNLDERESASARIEFRDIDGRSIADCGADCARTIPPHTGVTWAMETIDALPAGKGGGSAMVTGDHALLVVAGDVSMSDTVDTTLYAGAPAAGDIGRAPGAARLPLALRGGALRLSALGPRVALGDDAVQSIAGAGVTEIAVQNLDLANAATIAADFYNQRGGSPTSASRAGVPAEGSAAFDLSAERSLANGAYAVTLSADRAIGAIAETRWGSTGAEAVYGQPGEATEVLVPLVLKQALGQQTSIITVQNSDEAAKAVYDLALFASGTIGTPALLLGDKEIGPGTSVTLHLGVNPDFANLPAGFVGWARITSQTPVAVQTFVDVERSPRAVYAFEGVPAADLDEARFAPVVHARWTGDQPPPTATPSPTRPSPTPTATPTSPTATPTASTATPTAPTVTATMTARTPTPTVPGRDTATPTDTPTATDPPSETPPGPTSTVIATSTRRATRTFTPEATPAAASGWSRPLVAGLAPSADAGIRHMAAASDGSMWYRARGRRGRAVIIVLDPGGTPKVFQNLKAAVNDQQGRIRRLGGALSDFWTMDRRGRIWIGGDYFDGQRWVNVAGDDVRPEGGMAYAEKVLVDGEDRAWLPLEADAECLRPTGCRLTGLRGFGDAARFDREVTFKGVEEAGLYGVQDALLISAPRRGGFVTAAGPGNGPGGDGPAQPAGGGGWVVTPGGLYIPPDMTLIPYPMLGPPQAAATSALRNAGYATAATVRPDGRLEVFTWVELHRPRGTEYRIYANVWNGATWGQPVDLTSGLLFRGAVKHERVTAAAYAPDGLLWIGTASGKIGNFKLGLWGTVLEPGKPVDNPVRGTIRGLMVAPSGMLQVATDTGLYEYQNGRFDPKRILLPFASKQ